MCLCELYLLFVVVETITQIRMKYVFELDYLFRNIAHVCLCKCLHEYTMCVSVCVCESVSVCVCGRIREHGD